MGFRYDYLCEKCGNLQEEECSVKTFKEYRPTCNKCGGVCNYQFTPSVAQFALKDGPSGSWPSKGNRFKQYREKRSREVEKRQNERYGDVNRDALPNYKGQVCESWKEAQSLAMGDKETVDPLKTASTYNEKIEKETKIKTP